MKKKTKKTTPMTYKKIAKELATRYITTGNYRKLFKDGRI